MDEFKSSKTFKSLTIEQQKNIIIYFNQLDENGVKAYLIAKDHLSSSFNILKSNGYKEWTKNNSK